MSNATISNVRIFWPKLDKPRPSKYADKPASWSLQVRTNDLNEVKKWKAMLLKPKSHIPDDKDPESYFYINLYKRNVGKDGSKKAPPNVVDRRGHPMEPSIVGNGSLANVSLFGYEHQSESGLTTSFTLMGVQVLELVKYIAEPKHEFEDYGEDTPIIGTSGGDETEATHGGSFDDMDDDIPFDQEPAEAPKNNTVRTVTGTVEPRKAGMPPNPPPPNLPPKTRVKPDVGDEF